MIKFFRRIRKKLLDEGNLKRYLIYAIGEILLVVIGILIALQINNWNEDRKSRDQEVQYLERLVTDLTADDMYLAERVKNAEEEVLINKRFIDHVYEIQQDEEEYRELVKSLRWSTRHLVLQNSTYAELSNSGLLDLFQNKELKLQIISYYRKYDDYAAHVKEYNEFSTSIFREVSHLTNKYSDWAADYFDQSFMFHKSDWTFINDPTSYEFNQLINCATIYGLKHRDLNKYFVELRDQAIRLIKMTSEELVNRR
jgi:hypothetical protein